MAEKCKDRELATAGMIARLFDVTPSYVRQLARAGRLERRGWQRVGRARWPLYDVEDAGKVLGRDEVDLE